MNNNKEQQKAKKKLKRNFFREALIKEQFLELKKEQALNLKQGNKSIKSSNLICIIE